MRILDAGIMLLGSALIALACSGTEGAREALAGSGGQGSSEEQPSKAGSAQASPAAVYEEQNPACSVSWEQLKAAQGDGSSIGISIDPGYAVAEFPDRSLEDVVFNVKVLGHYKKDPEGTFKLLVPTYTESKNSVSLSVVCSGKEGDTGSSAADYIDSVRVLSRTPG